MYSSVSLARKVRNRGSPIVFDVEAHMFYHSIRLSLLTHRTPADNDPSQLVYHIKVTYDPLPQGMSIMLHFLLLSKSGLQKSATSMRCDAEYVEHYKKLIIRSRQSRHGVIPALNSEKLLNEVVANAC